jgi:hypothetical protein
MKFGPQGSWPCMPRTQADIEAVDRMMADGFVSGVFSDTKGVNRMDIPWHHYADPRSNRRGMMRCTVTKSGPGGWECECTHKDKWPSPVLTLPGGKKKQKGNDKGKTKGGKRSETAAIVEQGQLAAFASMVRTPWETLMGDISEAVASYISAITTMGRTHPSELLGRPSPEVAQDAMAQAGAELAAQQQELSTTAPASEPPATRGGNFRGNIVEERRSAAESTQGRANAESGRPRKRMSLRERRGQEADEPDAREENREGIWNRPQGLSPPLRDFRFSTPGPVIPPPEVWAGLEQELESIKSE